LIWSLLKQFQDEEAYKGKHLAATSDTFHTAFKVLSQDKTKGTGICLVAVALSVSLPSDTPSSIQTTFRASTIISSLEVITSLLQSESVSSNMEGIRLLSTVTGSRSTGRPTGSSSLGPYDLFSEQLWDGSLPSRDTLASRNQALLDKIPQLSEEEVVDHWDALAGVWDVGCQRSMTLSLKHQNRPDIPKLMDEVTVSS
jgi:hypothetical protein